MRGLKYWWGNKKPKYDIGNFVTDDPNDDGIAKYYYEQYQYLKEKCWHQQQKIWRLQKEIQHLQLQQPKLRIDDLDATFHRYEVK